MLTQNGTNQKVGCNEMDKILSILQVLTTAATGISGGYAALKLVMMGIAHMNKNPQKVEAARDGMQNVVIGFAVCLSAAVVVTWLKGAMG